MCNRCKAAVTRRGAVMESCRCDGSSLHPGAVRQMEPQSHPLTSHPAGIRGRVNLVKAEWDTFKKLEAFERLEFLCYLNTTDRKMREGGKAVTFLPINDSECWSSLFFLLFFFFFVLSWKFENSSVHIYSGNKRGWWRESLKIQKLNVVKYTKSILGQPPVQWPSGETPSHLSQPFNVFCWSPNQ